MIYTVKLRRDWEVPGKAFKRATPYRVPEDMTEKLAQRAINSGIATKTMPEITVKSVRRKKNAAASS